MAQADSSSRTFPPGPGRPSRCPLLLRSSPGCSHLQPQPLVPGPLVPGTGPRRRPMPDSVLPTRGPWSPTDSPRDRPPSKSLGLLSALRASLVTSLLPSSSAGCCSRPLPAHTWQTLPSGRGPGPDSAAHPPRAFRLTRTPGGRGEPERAPRALGLRQPMCIWSGPPRGSGPHAASPGRWGRERRGPPRTRRPPNASQLQKHLC